MAHFDLRNRDMTKKKTFAYLWVEASYKKLRLRFSPEEVSDDELRKFLIAKYEARYRPIGRFFNNITYKNVSMSLEAFMNKVLNDEVILSGYCTLFADHKVRNIAAEALTDLLDKRKYYKKLMEQQEKGSVEYAYYKVMQLTYKVLANSYYGILGMATSPFYNPFVQNSVTLSGQDIITTAITTMESFLGNNNKFDNVSTCLEFINNINDEIVEWKNLADNYEIELNELIKTSTGSEDEQKRQIKLTNMIYRLRGSILNYVDKEVSVDELMDYLSTRIIAETDLNKHLRPVVERLSPEVRTRVYYRNRLPEFLANENVKKLYIDNITKEEGYTSDSQTVSIICDYVLYDYLLDDRYKRVMKQTRNSSIVTDTDSVFLYLKTNVNKITDCIDRERDNLGLDLSAMNFLIDLSTEALTRIFWELTTNVGVEDEYKPIINFKNELNKGSYIEQSI